VSQHAAFGLEPPTNADGVRPRLTLGLMSVQHALIHGQSALYPLVYLAVIDEFGVSPATIVILSTIGGISSGLLQYALGAMTRWVGRPKLLAAGGFLTAIGTALQAAAPGFGPFAALNVVSRVGSAPQHPVGNALLAEQFPAGRIGTAIAVHVAGGNIGTVVVGATAGVAIAALGWRGAVLALGVLVLAVAASILALVREARVAADAPDAGPVRSLYRRVLADRDLRWLFGAAILGGGSRGLGVLNVFVPLYLDQVVGLDRATIGGMYAVLLAASVPGPLVAGWLSDRLGRTPVIVGVYVAGAVSLLLFVMAGHDQGLLWAAIVLLSLFSFVESPQLQALLADVTPRPIRDAAYSTYFALAFGVGSFWGFAYGAVVDVGGPGKGLGAVFLLMAGASVAAALATLRVRVPRRGETLAA
jgi:MFS family permease